MYLATADIYRTKFKNSQFTNSNNKHFSCNVYRCGKWTQRHELKILYGADCILEITNTLSKRMNLIVIPPAMGKQ